MTTLRLGLIWMLRILIGLYLAFGIFAVAVVLLDPSDDPLAAVFLVVAAIPWTWALAWLGGTSVWFNLVFLSAGMLVNVALLLLLERRLRARRL